MTVVWTFASWSSDLSGTFLPSVLEYGVQLRDFCTLDVWARVLYWRLSPPHSGIDFEKAVSINYFTLGESELVGADL